MKLTVQLPNANVALTQSGDTITRPYYNFLLGISKFNPTDVTAQINALTQEIQNISQGSLQGYVSVSIMPTITPGVRQISLVNDVLNPGNTTYYGTGPTGTKGWFPVAGTLLGTAGNITLVTASSGVTTFDIASLTDSGVGAALVKITRDAQGRISGTQSAALADLSNVSSTAPTDTYVLTWDAATSKWTPKVGGGGSSPLTTKGDVFTYSTVNARLPVGADTYVLTADSTQVTGLKWSAPSGGGSLPVTTKGDLLGFSTVAARVPVGADGQVLTADSTAAAGVSYKTPGGGGGFPGLPYVPPVAASFAWINQGGASLDGTYNQLGILAPAYAGTETWRILERALPGAYPWTLTTAIMYGPIFNDNYPSVGIGIKDTGNGKMLIFKGLVGTPLNTTVTSYSNASSGVANLFSATLMVAPVPVMWLRITADATNFNFFVSINGIQWRKLFQYGRTAYLTAPAKAFFCVNASPSYDNSASLVHWAFT